MGAEDRARVRSARAAAALTSGIAGFQVALAAGVPWGRAAWGGGSAELSEVLRVASGVTAALWAAATVTLLACSGDLAGGRLREDRRVRRAVGVVAAVCGVGTVVNLATPSEVERAIWVPVSFATALLATVAARPVRPVATTSA